MFSTAAWQRGNDIFKFIAFGKRFFFFFKCNLGMSFYLSCLEVFSDLNIYFMIQTHNILTLMIFKHFEILHLMLYIEIL